MKASNVATILDLKELKSDLKTDIKSLRTELKSETKSIRSELLRVEGKVENVEDNQKRLEMQIKEYRTETKLNDQKMNDKLDRLMKTVDGFVGRVDDLTVDNEVGTHHTRELQVKVKDLDKRLKHIESSKQAV